MNDPAFYEKMSALLDEIIAARKAKAIEYEAYLKRIAELAQQVEAGVAEDTPEELKASPAVRALYNNLREHISTDTGKATHEEQSAYAVGLAVKLDEAVKEARPDGWRGVRAREQVVKLAMYKVLEDEDEVERLFPIIKAQGEY